LAPDGSIYVIGSGEESIGHKNPNEPEESFLVFDEGEFVTRLHNDGTVDYTYNFGQPVFIQEHANALALNTTDGSAIVAGARDTYFGTVPSVSSLLGESFGPVELSSDGILLIRGSRKADRVRVDLDTVNDAIIVTRNGASYPFQRNDVTYMRMELAGGDDVLTLGHGVDVPFFQLETSENRIVVHAGAGNDTLVGNDSSLQFDAGSGDDFITSGAGSDLLQGGNGDDTIIAGQGYDTLVGGAGHDLLVAGGGKDVLTDRDREEDTLVGGEGDDTASFDGSDGVSDIFSGIEHTYPQ
jgi:Ca2+-binding RTX toxin-like protein